MPLTRRAMSSIVRMVMGSHFFMGRFFAWKMIDRSARGENQQKWVLNFFMGRFFFQNGSFKRSDTLNRLQTRSLYFFFVMD